MLEGLPELLALTALICVPFGTVALAYLWGVFVEDPKRPRSPFLLLLCGMGTGLWLVGLYFAAVTYIRLTIGLRGIPEWTQWLTLASTYFIAAALGSAALFIFRRRRGR